MLMRYTCALIALGAVLLSSGCCWDRFCCRHPCARICQLRNGSGAAPVVAAAPYCPPCNPCGP